MLKLVVNAEQAKVLTEARESVEIFDSNGNRLGFFTRPFSDHERVREISLPRGSAPSTHLR